MKFSNYIRDLQSAIAISQFSIQNIHLFQSKIKEAVNYVDARNPNEKKRTKSLFTNADALSGNPNENNFEDVKQDAINLLKKYS